MVAVNHFELELGAFRRVAVAVVHAGEGSGFSQARARCLEVVFADRLPGPQTAGRHHRLRPVALAAGHFDRDQGEGRMRSLFGGLPVCGLGGSWNGQQQQPGRGRYPEKGMVGDRHGQNSTAWHRAEQRSTGPAEFPHRLPTAASAVLIFTAISIKAKAARLSALSLRKTRAKSRRTWASAKGIRDSTPARTSSCT